MNILLISLISRRIKACWATDQYPQATIAAHATEMLECEKRRGLDAPAPCCPVPNPGTVPSLLYVTNATGNVSDGRRHRLLPPPDSLVTVASSGGGSGVSVLSPRGRCAPVARGLSRTSQTLSCLRPLFLCAPALDGMYLFCVKLINAVFGLVPLLLLPLLSAPTPLPPPRGSASGVRFGSEGLPYSGGLEVRHHRDGPGENTNTSPRTVATRTHTPKNARWKTTSKKRRWYVHRVLGFFPCVPSRPPTTSLYAPFTIAAGDVLVLELASSPGRVVGDARGRWGVGAVPRETGTKAIPQLAAALHVFGAPAAAAAAAVEPGTEAASKAPVAVLVEAAVGTAGVMQLLSDGESAPYPSPAANAIVLSSTSRQSGDHATHTSKTNGRKLPDERQ